MKRTLGIVLALLVMGSAAAQELVVNGGFETGNFSGWTQFGNTSFTSVLSGGAHGGTYYASFGPTSAGGIQQTLVAGPGTYHIGFWYYAAGGGASDYLTASLGGQQFFSIDGAKAPRQWANVWADVTVTTPNPVLQFTFLNSPSYWYVDDIGVPEPATAALLAVLALLRRR